MPPEWTLDNGIQPIANGFSTTVGLAEIEIQRNPHARSAFAQLLDDFSAFSQKPSRADGNKPGVRICAVPLNGQSRTRDSVPGPSIPRELIKAESWCAEAGDLALRREDHALVFRFPY